jgi:hypothetical protein
MQRVSIGSLVDVEVTAAPAGLLTGGHHSSPISLAGQVTNSLYHYTILCTFAPSHLCTIALLHHTTSATAAVDDDSGGGDGGGGGDGDGVPVAAAIHVLLILFCQYRFFLC